MPRLSLRWAHTHFVGFVMSQAATRSSIMVLDAAQLNTRSHLCQILRCIFLHNIVHTYTFSSQYNIIGYIWIGLDHKHSVIKRLYCDWELHSNLAWQHLPSFPMSSKFDQICIFTSELPSLENVEKMIIEKLPPNIPLVLYAGKLTQIWQFLVLVPAVLWQETLGYSSNTCLKYSYIIHVTSNYNRWLTTTIIDFNYLQGLVKTCCYRKNLCFHFRFMVNSGDFLWNIRLWTVGNAYFPCASGINLAYHERYVTSMLWIFTESKCPGGQMVPSLRITGTWLWIPLETILFLYEPRHKKTCLRGLWTE